MYRLFFAALAVLVAGCATSVQGGDADRTGLLTVRCDQGWAQCATQARRLCDNRPYTEVDRSSDEQLTTMGRLEQSDDRSGRYREDSRFEETNRVLIIRCEG